jgi:hypothetical protein
MTDAETIAVEFRGGVRVDRDAKGEWRWEAFSVAADPNADYPAPIEMVEMRSSEGYVDRVDCLHGARVTLRMLLARVTDYSEFRAQYFGDRRQGERIRFTILGVNGEELAVEGPVAGLVDRGEVTRALDRATLALLGAQVTGGGF